MTRTEMYQTVRAECAQHKALEKVGEWLDHIEKCPDPVCSKNRTNSQNPESQFLKPAVDAVRAALASPCCEGLREEEPTNEAWQALIAYAYTDGKDGARVIQEITTHYLHMRAELAAAQSEIARLTAERDRMCAHWSARDTAKEALAAELRQAVDALREAMKPNADLSVVMAAIKAYDAKRG